jgi:hypothetical protein
MFLVSRCHAQSGGGFSPQALMLKQLETCSSNISVDSIIQASNPLPSKDV